MVAGLLIQHMPRNFSIVILYTPSAPRCLLESYTAATRACKSRLPHRPLLDEAREARLFLRAPSRNGLCRVVGLYCT